MSKTIALAGTLDSKGKEFSYVKEVIESLGFDTLLINTGVFPSEIEADVSNVQVAEAAGVEIEQLAKRKDRAEATRVLAEGMEKLLPELYEQGKFDGVLSFGGTGGTSIVTPGMRALPIGVPKVMVSTVASGNTQPYIGTSDLVMIPSIVDVAGLNVISTKVFRQAVFAIAGMLDFQDKALADSDDHKKPLIAASMFGLTTSCINHAKSYLEDRGYEVLIFHATGIGGQTMESLIEEGFFVGVLDITTTEWADELIGGVLNAGPHRLEAAAKANVPQVVSVGAMDMANFGPYESVPEKFAGRKFYKHNPTVTLMRTTKEENKQIGEVIAQKLNMTKGQTTLMLPLKGLSGLDVEEQAFYGPEEDQALFNTLKKHIDSERVTVEEMDTDVNNPKFAEAAAERLIQMIESNKEEK
ncbi:Tm-1-like ATP-binding domain-containing protein [Virgibacillus sp. MSJ-26]|uniref:Tm-1-like ATP-binding domain-containing protein n=1 Tax=Virgibacillus sp. MSJ-26 TaxID=2841522 RepID=UPI001C12958B|nr:Tm-1-like ATP-binding domain-containing protein [Virgibacillus sp. MSJ-26]MBU5465791.1 Tm-1-like ATP-binding domain-containing protein [Virgibacillus sp. MSJ-26]